MLFDLVNPSDNVTFEAPTREAAVMAVTLLGMGHYGAIQIDKEGAEVEGSRQIPLALFVKDVDGWFADQLGTSDFKGLVEIHHDDVVRTLRSFVTADAKTRKMYEMALLKIKDSADRRAFIGEWDDTYRSSLNAITSRAHQLADQMEKANGLPQQKA